MGAASYRPTWQQALGRGLYLGVVTFLAALVVALPALIFADPPLDAWLLVVLGSALASLLGGVLLGRWSGTEISARGIRSGSGVSARGIRTVAGSVEPWSRVVDLRAERRGARTVVSVYLESGASMQLAAPYSGEFFAADPQFEMKVHALSHLWRCHRIGGLP